MKPRKSKEAVCEGTQSGISVHGSSIVIQNPSLEIRSKYPNIDWSLWPPPPEKEGELVVVNSRIICDDSRQNPFSVRSVMEIQCAKLSEEMPWLELLYGQSDQCDDYHSTQSIFAFVGVKQFNGMKSKLRIAFWAYSEPGEGKNWVDADCGRAKQKLSRDRDQGHDHESAADIFAGLERLRCDGEWHAVITLDRSREENKKKAPAIQDISDYQHITMEEDGSIILRECMGYGTGRKVTKEEFAKHDQHKLDELGGTGVSVEESSGSMKPTQHKTSEIRHEENEKRKRRKANNQDAVTAKRVADDAAIAVEQGSSGVWTCSCGQRLLSASGFHRHQAQECTKAAKRRKERKAQKPTVAQLLNQVDDSVKADIEIEHGDLAFVELELKKEHGLVCEFTDGAIVVKSVANPYASLELVEKNCQLCLFGDVDVAAKFDAAAAAGAASAALTAASAPDAADAVARARELFDEVTDGIVDQINDLQQPTRSGFDVLMHQSRHMVGHARHYVVRCEFVSFFTDNSFLAGSDPPHG